MVVNSDRESDSFEFQQAIMAGDMETVYELLKSGKAIKIKGNQTLIEGISPVEFAYRCGQTEIAFWLASDDAFSRVELEFLESIENGDIQAVQNIFEAYNLDPNQGIWPGDETSTPIGIAIINSDIEMVKLLLSLGFPPTSIHLTQAIRGVNLSIVQCLLNKGVDVNALNMSQHTALFPATATGNIEIVKAIVESGVNVNFQDRYEETALSLAASLGHRGIFDYLYPLTDTELRKHAERCWPEG